MTNSDVLYILNNDDIEFKYNGKKFKNTGLTNFIRLYRFIPDGISVVRKRRKNMSKTKKAPAKATKKAPAKKPAKAKTPAKAVKAPAKKSK